MKHNLVALLYYYIWPQKVSHWPWPAEFYYLKKNETIWLKEY